MRKYLLPFASLLAAVSIANTSFAQTPNMPEPPQGEMRGHHFGHGEKDRGPMHVLKQLNLSDAQKAKVKSIMQAEHTNRKAEFEALKTQREAFMKSTPGTAAFDSAKNALAEAEANAARTRVQHMGDVRSKVYAELTADQKAKLSSLEAQMPKFDRHHK